MKIELELTQNQIDMLRSIFNTPSSKLEDIINNYKDGYMNNYKEFSNEDVDNLQNYIYTKLPGNIPEEPYI